MNAYKIILLVTLQVTSAQVIDLSQPWNTNTSFPLSQELEGAVTTHIESLPNTLGFIVIYQGQIVSENYYNSYTNNSINIWSVTKSYMSTLIGQAVEMGMINDPDSSATYFFSFYLITYVFP